MRINNNLMAMNTHRQLGINTNASAKSIEKLSSGYRINRAGDDAAGLAISEKMRAQIRGLDQASSNSQDGISMIQTAEGALNETQAILQRMRELAVQSANDTNVDADRTSIQDEIDQLADEITRIADTTEFNTQNLLDGTLDDIKFQIGANYGQDMSLSIGDMSAEALDVVSDTIDIGSQGDGIQGVEADLGFDIENAELTATAGGAVGASTESSGVTTERYASDITMSYSIGVTNSGEVSFNGADKITLAASDVPWNNLNLSGDDGSTTYSGSISITAEVSGIKVTYHAVSASGVTYSGEDYAYANASGNYVYDNHGISFTLNADDYAALSGSTLGVVIDLDDIASGAAVSVAGDIDTASNFTQGLVGSGTVYASFSGDIAIDAASGQWIEGVGKIVISGSDLFASGGSIRITLQNSGGTVDYATDVITYSGINMNSGVISYDAHGISFTLNVGHTSGIQVSVGIEVIDESVSIGDDAFEFTITDDNGASFNVSVDVDSGATTISGIADAINAAISGLSGATFSSDVATVTSGKLKLSAGDTGADSTVDITDVGGLSAFFASGEVNGSDQSINFTLTIGSGTTLTKSGVVTTATSVTFTDSNGNDATFSLDGYDSLSGVDVTETYAASSMERTVAGIDVSTQSKASAAITTINNAIESVSTERSKLGAVQNRLEHTIKNLDTSSENLTASESRIRDVDMAKEMMEYTKNNILQQAAQAMLAQANQAPQGVLQLLG